MIKDNIEKMKKKSTRPNNGGKRPGAGRKPGGMNKKTLEQRIVEEEIKQRVLGNAQRLIDAQFSLAQGCSFLYCIKTTKKSKDKPELITNHRTIEEYLSGDLDNNNNEYYYITTEKPNGYSIDSLLDRTFGKAIQKTELVGKDGEGIRFIIEKH